MGMYTEIVFAAEVDREAYEAIEKAARGVAPESDHPLWSTPRWSHLFHGGSYYFPQANHFKLEADDVGQPRPMYSVSFRSNLKNYNGEIEEFFDWVKPHVAHYGSDRTHIGHFRYEEDDEPTLVYKERG